MEVDVVRRRAGHVGSGFVERKGHTEVVDDFAEAVVLADVTLSGCSEGSIYANLSRAAEILLL